MARPRSDTIKRFLDKVKQVETGCHEWQAGQARGGYGKYQDAGKTVTAHRFAYENFVGPIGSMHVLHKCDNRKCVNPEHLFLGTNADNIADMDAKGRRVHTTKVTLEMASQIKAMRAERYSQQYIADHFGVSQGLVSRLLRGVTRNFKH